MNPLDPNFLSASFLPPTCKPGRKDREDSFEETAVKAVCRAATDPDRLLMELKRAHQERTGEWGLALRELRQLADFPLDLAACVTPPASPGYVLTKFESTSLYGRWRERLELVPEWGPAGRRGLVFHWIQWGVCILHDADWADPTPGRLVVVAESATLFIDDLTSLARAVRWHHAGAP